LNPEGTLPVLTLDHGVESVVAAAIQSTDRGSLFALDPQVAQKIMNNLARSLQRAGEMNYQPVVVCSAQIRGQFKKLVDQFIPNVSVLSYDEIMKNVDIQSLGTLELTDADQKV
jgi:flagellar biosynthesis protein FlhA